MGKIEGIIIKNYGALKNIMMGKTRTNQEATELGNMVTIIGSSGNGKSTLSDAFGFIADCIQLDVERACDGNNRGGFEQLRSQRDNLRETQDSRKARFYKGYRGCGKLSDVLDFKRYATHMQQVCNTNINDMYRTFFSKELLESVLFF